MLSLTPEVCDAIRLVLDLALTVTDRTEEEEQAIADLEAALEVSQRDE